MIFQKKQRHSLHWLLALAALPLITSCGIIPDLQKENTDDPDEKFDFVKRNNNERYKEADEVRPDKVDIKTDGAARKDLQKKADALSKSPYDKKYSKTPAEKTGLRRKRFLPLRFCHRTAETS